MAWCLGTGLALATVCDTLSIPFFCLWLCAAPGQATIPDCEDLAEHAGQAEGVPSGVMRAIARIESGYTVGGQFRAWPWTINRAGKGSYHPSKSEALALAQAALKSGRRNVDLWVYADQLALAW